MQNGQNILIKFLFLSQSSYFWEYLGMVASSLLPQGLWWKTPIVESIFSKTAGWIVLLTEYLWPAASAFKMLNFNPDDTKINIPSLLGLRNSLSTTMICIVTLDLKFCVPLFTYTHNYSPGSEICPLNLCGQLVQWISWIVIKMATQYNC